MKKIFLLLSITFITVKVQAVGTIEIAATQGKLTDWRSPDTVQGSTTQLATRNGTPPDAKKSWLQFDLSGLYAENPSIKGHILDAKLTFYGAKTESSAKSYAVNGLNDAANLENWIASELTWNNAPGNDVASGAALNTSLTTSLYTATIPTPILDVISETPEASRTALTDYLNTDTDGKITFIFTAGSTCYLWNAGQPLGPVLTLTYELGKNPEKAHDQIPADDAIVEKSLALLSWINPEPNNPGDPIYCDVYLGIDPNRLNMDKKSLGDNVTQVAVNNTNFSTYGVLTNNTMYYWYVDCYDPVKGRIEGEEWSFFVGQAPNVDAGADQAAWLGKSGVAGQEVITLNGTSFDDGSWTVLWTQEANEAPTVTISPNNQDDTSVTITARGVYEFTLTADDGTLQSSDTVRVVIGNNACDASHLNSGQAYPEADQNQDCIVNLSDLVALIVDDWLGCTDTLTHCGQ
jgi:hypothetical protein